MVISNIPGGASEGNAKASDVLSGKTFSNDDDAGLTGSMPNNGAVSGSVGVGGSYTVPAGYHNGSGKVTGPTLDGNAGTGDVLSGKTFYSNSGTKQSGSMHNLSAESQWQYDSGNGTKAIITDGFFSRTNLYNNATGATKTATVMRWSGDPGYITPNTLPAIEGNCYTQSEYDSNYNKGVTDADNRVNSNSTNYKSGYTDGKNKGFNQGYSEGHALGRMEGEDEGKVVGISMSINGPVGARVEITRENHPWTIIHHTLGGNINVGSTDSNGSNLALEETRDISSYSSVHVTLTSGSWAWFDLIT